MSILSALIKPMTSKMVENKLIKVATKYCNENAEPKNLPIICFNCIMSTPPNLITFKLADFRPMKMYETYSTDSTIIIKDLADTFFPLMTDELLNAEKPFDASVIVYPYLCEKTFRFNATILFKDLDIWTNSIKLPFHLDRKSKQTYLLDTNTEYRSEDIDSFSGYDTTKMPFLGETRPYEYH